MNFRITALACLIATSATQALGQSRARQSVVPFVGCFSDGQAGPGSAPKGVPKSVAVDSQLAQRIAYYKGDQSSGVFAPRGWHCRVWYGSAGSTILAAPVATDTTRFEPTSILGDAIELESRAAGTSGRFDVAAYATRLFPSRLKHYIESVRSEGLGFSPDSALARFAKDTVRLIAPLEAAFVTPARARGLGTDWVIAPSAAPIYGYAVIEESEDEPDMSLLRVRLTGPQGNLRQVIMELNKACLRLRQGCE